ncbi:hypothetical protein RCO48_22475 [Peribacillus frigoritolerans]|nr:hypothetical protein [Peribacillus frigoritolerans]
MIELFRKGKASYTSYRKTLNRKLKIIIKRSTTYPNRKSHYKVNIENLEQMISDLKDKENYHQQEIDQLNQTIAGVSRTRK